MPKDRYNREINYLRISLTDHCNLRCRYCMPLTGLRFVASRELLAAAEIQTVVHAAAEVGFRKVRLTGGEPMLREDLPEIVRRVRAVGRITDLSMTTNAILLPAMAQLLADAGLMRVNVHLDTLHPDRLRRLMRFGTVEEIWQGLEAAEDAGLTPIKLNVVVVRGFNDEDVVDLAKLTLSRDWHVRFIETMPLGGGECARLAVSHFVPTADTLSRIQADLGPLTPVDSDNPADEARNYRLPEARGVVGFISPVSEPYCGTCNRMRLTAEGKLHLCLLNDDELDVRSALRNGGGIGAVRRILLRAVADKPTGHRLEQGISTERREMFQIGG